MRNLERKVDRVFADLTRHSDSTCEEATSLPEIHSILGPRSVSTSGKPRARASCERSSGIVFESSTGCIETPPDVANDLAKSAVRYIW